MPDMVSRRAFVESHSGATPFARMSSCARAHATKVQLFRCHSNPAGPMPPRVPRRTEFHRPQYTARDHRSLTLDGKGKVLACGELADHSRDPPTCRSRCCPWRSRPTSSAQPQARSRSLPSGEGRSRRRPLASKLTESGLIPGPDGRVGPRNVIVEGIAHPSIVEGLAHTIL